MGGKTTMTTEEKREYNAQYRREGYGANGDARYRIKHLHEYRKKNSERMARKRLQAKQAQQGISS